MNRSLYALIGIAIAAGVVIGSDTLFTDATPTSFVETFDGIPGSPEPFSSPHWDLQVTERGMGQDYDPGELPAQDNVQHGMTCGSPDTVHTVNNTTDAVFRCNGHVMTALNGKSYGAIFMTPDHMVDFSDGEAVVRFSVNTLDQSKRDWLDIWITPWEKNLAVPVQEGFGAGLNGAPDDTVAFVQAADVNKWKITHRKDDNGTSTSDSAILNNLGLFTPEFAARETLEIRISATGASLRLPDYNYTVRTLTFPQALDWTQGVVTFAHHSYNPTKDGAGLPNTWHWDDFEINPAVAFTMNTVTPRYVEHHSNTTHTPVTLNFAAAPANAFLRFHAIGGVKVNGVLATPQVNDNDGHATSYFVPIPEGSTSATIQMVTDNWWDCGRGCLSQDFAIWSMNTSSGTATPTASATPTPTDTPTESPSSTSVPSTATPTPTASASPTATVTPAYTLVVSGSSNRANPVPLDGATVSGNIYAFTTPDDAAVDKVRFFIDSGPLYRTENNGPYDLGGGSVTVANAFNTNSLSNGQHTITAAVDLIGGGTEWVTATVTVAN